MSTTSLRALIAEAQCVRQFGSCVHCGAEDELAAIERAATIIAKGTRDGWPTTEMGRLNMMRAFEVMQEFAASPSHTPEGPDTGKGST